jgi:hypothetical protein
VSQAEKISVIRLTVFEITELFAANSHFRSMIRSSHSTVKPAMSGQFPSVVASLFRLGAKLPINTQLAAYGNVAKPEFGPDWQLRFQIQFLFPK